MLVAAEVVQPLLSSLLGQALVLFDAAGEFVRVGVHQEVPDFEVMAGQAVEDLLHVVPAKQGHGRDQDATDVGVDLGGGRHHELPPGRPVLEVVDGLGEDVAEHVADLLRIVDPSMGRSCTSSLAVLVLPAPNAPLIQRII